jgi:hypothetical protein
MLPAAKSRRAMNDTLCGWAGAANSRWLTTSPAQTNMFLFGIGMVSSDKLKENPFEAAVAFRSSNGK